MTNLQIITESALAVGLYTEEQVKAFFENGSSLPLHTFKEWQHMGYQVRKGEKAALTCYIWRFKKKSSDTQPQDGDEQEITEGNFYKTKAFFFTAEQVDAIKAA